jgi:hypothetical protein
MELKDIKYKGDKINKATAKSIYELYDESIGGVLYTGSYRKCWIRRIYINQYDKNPKDIEKYIIRINEELTKEKELNII